MEKQTKETPPVLGFQGEHRFLSNFWPCRCELEGMAFPSTENAYQAARFPAGERAQLQGVPSWQAKKMGRGRAHVVAMSKADLMEFLNRQKFSDKNPELKAKLLATGDAELVEVNTWNDQYWGVCNGVGLNTLGKILMKIRAEITKAD